jgi:predicted AlkP superfamily phosphohydrolase/phosphomutase
VTSFDKLDVNWEKTRVWSEGGYYARVFFNVKGREPQGVIDPADYERFRDEVRAKFEATADPRAGRWARSSSSPRRSTATCGTWRPT